MALALFDLDHTLLPDDSDHAWGRFLAEHGVVPQAFADRSDEYLAQYQAGQLDIHEFLAFQLTPLVEGRYEALVELRKTYIDEKIRPFITEAARELVERHRRRGDTLAIITATNDFITRPIAALFGVEHLIATELEFVDGAFTGKIVGDPCFREGKISRLNDWLARSAVDLTDSWFYSDSHNDLPLLERVAHAVAVNPDPVLEREARRRHWPIHRF